MVLYFSENSKMIGFVFGLLILGFVLIRFFKKYDKQIDEYNDFVNKYNELAEECEKYEKELIEKNGVIEKMKTLLFDKKLK